MTTTTTGTGVRVTPEQVEAYRRDGFHVARGLIPVEEAAAIREAFMREHAELVARAVENPRPAAERYSRYPRILDPHKRMPLARRYLLDARLFDVVEALLGEPALTAQTMFYVKPPGALGQAFHQDNAFLQVKPGTCIAAWMPVDPSDEGNGGLQVVPGTHLLDLVCPDEDADPEESFTSQVVRPPEGFEALQLRLVPGDVLFFHGNLIHGSQPNRSADRFRRVFICHYLPASGESIDKYYDTTLDRHGRVHGREYTDDGGPCGTESVKH